MLLTVVPNFLIYMHINTVLETEYELNAAIVKHIIPVRKWYIFLQEGRKKKIHEQ